MAIVLMLVLELGLDICTHYGVLASTATAGAGNDAEDASKPLGLWDAYFSTMEVNFPDPNGLRSMLEVWTFGAYPAVLEYLFALFDMPDMMAVTRVTVCSEGWGSISRSTSLLYYIAYILYFWVLCVPVVSWIFGCYLYLCVNWLHIHYDESFSALRIPHYKSFLRMQILENGNLQMFAIGIRKVPRKWTRNIDQSTSSDTKHESADFKASPSKWCPAPGQCGSKDTAGCGAEVVDYLLVPKKSHKNSLY
eukprot:CAMPEP_0196589178 /NCGR_PEP_ID=MMETSP1081-20130531/62925_1 /TAXON_ID=36882 /ORGANISM="Pyramimonas amylifera, Strain CCMP720" /LENGTH=249 /DNA_ID=CAMNT_0041911907 /DNA_START=159 /DNA_END=908 /DNA_ORIENTATION=-